MFGHNAQVAAQQAAARAEMDRLCALPAVELAAEILPGWGPEGAHRVMKNPPNVLLIANWLMESYPQRPRLNPLVQPVREAIAVLESACLLLRTSLSSGSHVELTPLGERMLTEGTVRQHLSLAPATEAEV